MSVNEQPNKGHPGGSGKRPIHMWMGERVECAGQVFWIVLDESLRPISDVTLQDVQDIPGDETTPASFLLVRSARASTSSCGLDRKGLERLVIGAIRKILEQGDATTYRVYEALICEFGCSEYGEDMSIDVAALLRDNFWYYETPIVGGSLKVTWWTLNQEHARTGLCVTQIGSHILPS